MVEAEPLTFSVAEQDSMICLKRVTMQRAFEADKSGRTTIRVKVEAEAKPATDGFETIEGSVEFVLYNGESRLGSCAAGGIKFTDEDDVVELIADDGLRIGTHEDVTHMEVEIEAAKVTKSRSKLKLTPE